MRARQEQQAVDIARRLDERSREILRSLLDHELLLTYQLKVLFFSSLRRCQQVMRELENLGLVARDYPSQEIGVGKAQSHFTITELGVRVVAVLMGVSRSRIEWMPRDSYHSSDRHFDHLLGVNPSRTRSREVGHREIREDQVELDTPRRVRQISTPGRSLRLLFRV